jgi:hypothetical protein
VSKVSSKQIPADIARIFTRMHAPERLGMGSDREDDLRQP